MCSHLQSDGQERTNGRESDDSCLCVFFACILFFTCMSEYRDGVRAKRQGETRIHFQVRVRDHLPLTVIRTQLSVEMRIGNACLPRLLNICVQNFPITNELQTNYILKRNTAVYAELEML